MIDKEILLPTVKSGISAEKKTLPFNGSAVIAGKSFSFSFACFDRSHDLFNLGGNSQDGVVSGKWFIDLIDCFKSVSNMTVEEVKRSLHDLHPVDWSHANTKPPDDNPQNEYWQFRINKSKGRVIGLLIDSVFYVIWLDPYHNLSDSEGYGTVKTYKPAYSSYEECMRQIEEKDKYITQLEMDLAAAEELIFETPSLSNNSKCMELKNKKWMH